MLDLDKLCDIYVDFDSGKAVQPVYVPITNHLNEGFELLAIGKASNVKLFQQGAFAHYLEGNFSYTVRR